MKMKKRIVSLMVVLIMLFSNSATAQAAPVSDEFANKKEMERQERIDIEMENLNRIVLEEKQDRVLEREGRSQGRGAQEKEKREINKRDCERILEDLGMHKIDPNNPKDKAMLEELQQGLASQEGATFSTRASVYDTAPDFNIIANVYSLYIYNGTYKHNGTSYNYRYIRVVDDKGYNGLYYYQDNDLAVNVPAYKMESVFMYNFGYGVSTLIGSVWGTPVDWLLGNIFNLVSAEEEAKTILCGNKPLYGVRHISVTEMTYYFFYNNGWKHIGTSGRADVIREDYFYGNVNGKPVSETQKTSFTISSDWIWYDFVKQYAEVKDSRPNYCCIQDFGGLMIRGFNGEEYYFAPIFAEPYELI